jgi:hypothetical protein
MCRKLTSLIAVVLVLGLVGSASADFLQWTDYFPDSNSFCEPNNWKVGGTGCPGTAPDAVTAEDDVQIRLYVPNAGGCHGPLAAPILACTVYVRSMEGPYKKQNMLIGHGGNFNILEDWWWDDLDQNEKSTITITEDPTVVVGGDWLIGYRQQNSEWTVDVNGTPEIRVHGNIKSTYGDNEDGRNTTEFYLNMGGGSLVVDGGITWGNENDEDGGGGELNVSGGATITCSTLAYEGGGRRDWTLNLDGNGRITVIGEFRAPGSDPNLAHGDANAFINIDDGTLECGSFNHGGYPYAMDINEGEFIIHGDNEANMLADVAAGYITAFNGTEDVIVEVVDGNTIVRADYAIVKASDESPGNFDTDVCPGVQLSWQAGAYCVDDHNVYFGTSMSDVNEGASPYLDGHDTNSFTPSLELGKTYYWRVDEVNDACDASPWVGDIWEFTTNDGSMYDPYPKDLAIRVDPNNVELQWTSGCTTESHDVYLGTDFGEVEDANRTIHPNVEYDNVPDANYTPPGLDFSTHYYWRVDEVNDSNTYKGRVWQFKTRGLIVDPNMIVWYKFDETSGSTVMDSSGYEIRGDIYEYRGDTWDPNDGRFPGCIHFHEDERIDLADDVFDYIGESISISVWWKDAFREDEDNNYFCGFGDDDLELLVRADSEGEDEDDHGVRWRAGNDTNDRLEWTTDGLTWKDDWHHLVFTKNGPEGTMKIYFDTVLVESTTKASGVTLGQAAANAEKGFNIGTDRDGDADFAGKADDFRVYRCEISRSKINELFRGGDVGSAWAPSPYDGETDLPYDVNLSWRPGDYVNDVDGHDVYIGTDFDEVNDANSSIHPNVDYYNVSETNCDPGPLAVDQTYYWRVDEVNDSCSPYLWKGNIWRFTVAEYIIIDDMEDYTEGFASEHPISDGWQVGGGGTLGLGLIDYLNPVRGLQSMVCYYDNGPDLYYSEVGTKSLDPCDWTIAGMKMLTLWFHGENDPYNNDANETEQMYVGLEDNGNEYAEVRYPMEDMDDIRLLDWTEWNIALSEFEANNPDVNLTNIETLYIGFGDRNGSEAGGFGTVYFDDIRLYPPTCVLSYGQPELDWNNDCIVDFGEIDIMAEQWLEADVNLGQVSEPCDANLVGWWKFDEGSGSTADDSSIYNNDGTLEILDVNVSWTTAGYDGNALEFDGGRVRVADDPELRPLDQVSVSAWIKYSDKQNSARVVVKGADDEETFGLEVDDDDQLLFHVRDGNDYDVDENEYVNYEAQSDDDELDRDEWIHVAGTFDGNSVKCYINGELADTDDASELLFLCQDTNDLAIGNKSDANDRPFEGIIDDVRVYDYGLSEPEIGYLASGGTGIVTVQSVANLVNDEPLGERAVNFRDFDILADAWLEQKLWPE